MMSIIYSPSKNAFFDTDWMDLYQKSNTWPSDGVSVSDEDHIMYVSSPPPNKQLGNVNGYPGWINIPTVTPPSPLPVSEQIAILTQQLAAISQQINALAANT